MKTLTQEKGHDPIDCINELHQFLESVDEQKYSELRAKALSWETCPCGNQSILVFRHKDYSPTDTTLERLGAQFFDAFTDREFENAINLAALINVRGEFLRQQAIKQTEMQQNLEIG